MENKVPSGPPPTEGAASEAGKGGVCFLAIVFIIAGFAAIIFGFYAAAEYSDKYLGSGYWSTDHGLAATYRVGGIMLGLFNFALAVIVDACQKHRKANKG